MTLVGGNLTYTGGNVTNTLGLSLAGPTYTFFNPLDQFDLPAPAGVTYTDTNADTLFDTATVANAAVSQFTINLGTGANTVNLGAFASGIDPITVTGGGNVGSALTVLAAGTGITTAGDVSFTGFNSISVLNQITAANVTLEADQMTISQDVDAGAGTIQLRTTSAGRLIQLGAASSATQLGFTQAHLSNLFAGLVSIGSGASGGAIEVAANTTFNAADVTRLALNSNSSITGASTLAVENLSFAATGNVTLTGTWDEVAGTSGGAVSLTNSQSLRVDAVNGINGITATGNVSISVQGANNLLTVAQLIRSTAGAITLSSDRQAINSDVNATGNRVMLQPTTAGRLIDVGGADTATVLGFLSDELNHVTASTLQLGRTTAGNISTSAAVAPVGITTLVLITGGSASGAGLITADQFRFDSTTGPVNLTGSWNTVAGVSGGSVTLVNNKSLTIGTVDGVSGIQAATTLSVTASGSLTVANNVSSSGASAVSLVTVDAGGTGQNIVVNSGVTVSSTGGAVNLHAGDDLTVTSSATVQSSGAGQLSLRVDFNSADAAGGILQTTGATLSAPARASLQGSNDDDQFFVSSSANTAIAVNGNGGNNSLEFNAGGLATTVSGNSLTATGRQPVTFTNINVNPIRLVNTSSVTVLGSGVADTLTLFGTGAGVEASLNGGPRFNVGAVPFSFDGQGGVNTVNFDYLNGNAIPAGGTTFTNVTLYSVLGTNGVDLVELSKSGAVTGFTINGNAFVALTGVTQFSFHGRLGDDVLTVRYGNLPGDDPVPAGGVDYFGEGDDDALAVISPLSAGRSGSYLPSASTFGDGLISVGAGQIRFSSLAPVDVTGFASFTALFPNDNDNITLAPGLAFTVPGQTAIRMSGTSGAVPVAFETLAIWNVTNFTVDTTFVQGTDTIIFAGTGPIANHLITNINIQAGNNDDTLTVTAPIILSGSLVVNMGAQTDTATFNATSTTGSVSVTSETININANVTANSTTVQLLSVDNLNVAGVTVSGRTGITQTGATDAVVLNGVAPVLTQFTSSDGFVNFGSNINATTANVQQLTVSAQTDVTLQSIGNNVRLGTLVVSSSAGSNLLQGTTYNAGPQTYTTLTSQATVVSAATATFNGVATQVRFNSPFRGNAVGGTDVTVNTTGNTIFEQAVGSVALRSLSTNNGGSTFFNGSTVTTTLNQDYQDDVVLDSSVDLTTMTTLTNGNMTFGETLNVGGDAQDITLSSGAGTISFEGDVGNAVPRIQDVRVTSAGDVLVGATLLNQFTVSGFNQLAGSGTTTFNAVTNINNATGSALAIIANITNNAIVLNNNLTSEQDLRFNANTAGVTQTAGSIDTNRLLFAGTGTFDVNQLSNIVFIDFQANVNGDILLAAQNLVISQSGVTTSSDDVTLRTAFNFTSTPSLPGGQLVTLGLGDFQLFHGLSGNSEVVLKSEIVAGTVNLGAPPLTPLVNQNNNKDQYTIRPSANVMIKIWGNIPLNNSVSALNDELTMDFLDLPANEPINLVSNELNPPSGSFQGTFSFPNGTRKDTYYHSIEQFGALRLVASVFQTVAGQAQVVLGAKLSDRNINFKMPSVNIPANAFVVNPRLVNPRAPFSAPRIAMGDVDGDGSDDLVLAGGSNRSPVVVVIDGKKLTLNALSGSALSNIENLPRDFYLAQFLAYESSFMGGVFVAVGKMDADDGSPQAQIVVGPGAGRAPEVRVFTLNNGTKQMDRYRNPDATVTPTPLSTVGDLAFMAYESTYKGGVRVAVRNTGDADGLNEIVTAPGTGRVSTLRYFKNTLTSSSTPTLLPGKEFAPYGSTFKGGMYLASGDYDSDGIDDVLVGPGVGTSARVKVYDSNTSTKLVDFVAFNAERPSSLVSASTLNVGVGGVAFSRDASGQLGILVGTGPGRQTQARFFTRATLTTENVSLGVASNPNVFTIFPTGTLPSGTWSITVSGKTLSGLEYDITDCCLLKKLNSATMLNGKVESVTGGLGTAFVITFKESSVAKFIPTITLKTSVPSTTPLLAGAFSSSTMLVQDYLGNYFRYDTILITALATNRYRDGVITQVATK